MNIAPAKRPLLSKGPWQLHGIGPEKFVIRKQREDGSTVSVEKVDGLRLGLQRFQELMTAGQEESA